MSAPGLSEPGALRVVSRRHIGRWVAAAVVLVVIGALAWSLWQNPNLNRQVVLHYLFADVTLSGVRVTIELTVIAMVIGIGGAVVLALMRLSGNPVLAAVSWLYIWFFRGTPLLVQIIFWGFLGALYHRITIGIPGTGVVLYSANTNALVGALMAAILALSLNEAAYAAEIVRAGILSVHRGQQEAALALGMTPARTMRRIILPQAMRVIIPPMGNETISMLKSTSLVSVIAGHDLLTNLQNVYAQTFQVIPLLVVASIWYLALTTVLSIGQAQIEKRYGRGVTKSKQSRRSIRAVFNVQRLSHG
jgi:polar amino acid transport system permease protein